MSIEIRGITSEQHLDFIRAMSTPFGFDLEPDEEEADLARFAGYFETDRARCAYDGKQIVGTLGAFSFQMAVPGAAVACAGTTMVTVSPTHRRRGLLRRLMEAHFEDAREHGDPIAALWASDSAIYGRFGYGVATMGAAAKIDRNHVGFHRLAPAPASVRAITAGEAPDLLPPVFDRVKRPGMFERSKPWWDRRFRDRSADRDGATAFRYAVAEDSSGLTGYVQYRLKEGWTHNHGNGKVLVRELIAVDPAAAAGLWTLVLNHDLVKEIVVENRPEDDPLFALLAAGRRAAPKLTDGVYARVIDMAAAMAGRRYGADGRLGLLVRDPMDGSVAAGTLEVSDGVGVWHRDEGPDPIELDCEDLGSAYLGRARLRMLARAGRVRGSATALGMADAMFGWDPAPWCQEEF